MGRCPAPLCQLLLLESCVKLELQGGCVPNALDLVAHSTAAHQRPAAGTQLLSCLAKRIALMPDLAARQEVKRQLLQWLDDRGADLGYERIETAWALTEDQDRRRHYLIPFSANLPTTYPH